MNGIENTENQQNSMFTSDSIKEIGIKEVCGELLKECESSMNDELCFVRRILGYSQQDFASKLGVSKNAVSIYETKRDAVSLVTALRVHFLLSEYIENPANYGLRKVQTEALRESKDVFYKGCRSQMGI